MKSLLLPFVLVLNFSSVTAKTMTVKIESMKFIPDKFYVEVGDTIEWDNKDFFPHTATAWDKSFDSKSIPSQGKWSTKIQKSGTVKYFCRFHPVMKAILIVQ